MTNQNTKLLDDYLFESHAYYLLNKINSDTHTKACNLCYELYQNKILENYTIDQIIELSKN